MAILTLKFGALSAPIKQQLAEYGYKISGDKGELAGLEKIRHSIVLLHVAGIITDGEADKAFGRLMKRISNQLVPSNARPHKEPRP